MSQLLTKSEGFKEEYCCSVVRIGTLTPIEGSDFLAKTDILGTQIVVRKDQVHEGDVMFYAANETALNEKFLSLNNLFEIGCREKNANACEVISIMREYDINYRAEADKLRGKAKDVKGKINSFTLQASKNNKKIKKLQEELDNINTGKVTPEEGQVEELQSKIQTLQEKTDASTAKAMKLTVEYTNLKNKVEELVTAGKPIVEKAQKLCGFFNKYCRVRCITLRGEPSFGFVFGVSEMAKFCPEIADISIEDYVGTDFDTVNCELFVKVFVPPVKPQNVRRSKGERRNKKLSRFNRLVDGEFSFHYDTQQLNRSMHLFSPNTNIVASVKLHGTSVIIGKLHVREPKKVAPYKWLWNKFVDNTGLFKSLRCIDYDVVYGPVYSSRTVIKNQYINTEVNPGFYNKDIWSEYGDIIYPYLDEGMTVYGEIIGYTTGTMQMIQKHYDYGCHEGENKIMFYRITTTNEDGSKKEWEVQDVHTWTEILIAKMKLYGNPNWTRIHPIDILYTGTLGDLYPDLDPNEHWHENCLQCMKNDKEHFGAEELEPLCNNEVPREGIVVRIANDTVKEAFKLKSMAFGLKEAVLVDAGEVDIEMLDNYGNDAVQEEENNQEEQN